MHRASKTQVTLQLWAENSTKFLRMSRAQTVESRRHVDEAFIFDFFLFPKLFCQVSVLADSFYVSMTFLFANQEPELCGNDRKSNVRVIYSLHFVSVKYRQVEYVEKIEKKKRKFFIVEVGMAAIGLLVYSNRINQPIHFVFVL